MSFQVYMIHYIWVKFHFAAEETFVAVKINY